MYFARKGKTIFGFFGANEFLTGRANDDVLRQAIRRKLPRAEILGVSEAIERQWVSEHLVLNERYAAGNKWPIRFPGSVEILF